MTSHQMNSFYKQKVDVRSSNMFFTQKRHDDKHIACHIYYLQPEFCLQPKTYQKKMVTDHKPHNKERKRVCSHSCYDFYASAPSKISQPLFDIFSPYIHLHLAQGQDCSTQTKICCYNWFPSVENDLCAVYLSA